MPFKDTNEGSTHYQNDGCGEPAHNNLPHPPIEQEIEAFEKIIDNLPARVGETPKSKNLMKEQCCKQNVKCEIRGCDCYCHKEVDTNYCKKCNCFCGCHPCKHTDNNLTS